MISLTDDGEFLKKEAHKMTKDIFNLQELYYKSFNDSINLNEKLREFLIEYGSKYRLIFKKYNKLLERLESNSIKSNLSAIVNREENDRFKDTIKINKYELNTFNDIFQIKYNEDDLNNFKDQVNIRNEEKDKLTLLKGAELIFSNPVNISKLDDHKKKLLVIIQINKGKSILKVRYSNGKYSINYI